MDECKPLKLGTPAVQIWKLNRGENLKAGTKVSVGDILFAKHEVEGEAAAASGAGASTGDKSGSGAGGGDDAGKGGKAAAAAAVAAAAGW